MDCMLSREMSLRYFRKSGSTPERPPLLYLIKTKHSREKYFCVRLCGVCRIISQDPAVSFLLSYLARMDAIKTLIVRRFRCVFFLLRGRLRKKEKQKREEKS